MVDFGKTQLPFLSFFLLVVGNNGVGAAQSCADLSTVDVALKDLELTGLAANRQPNHYDLVFTSDSVLASTQCAIKRLKIGDGCGMHSGRCTIEVPGTFKAEFDLLDANPGVLFAKQISPDSGYQFWKIIYFEKHEDKKYVCCALCDEDACTKDPIVHCLMEDGGNFDLLNEEVKRLERNDVTGHLTEVWNTECDNE